jgi:hypothetical protein
MTGWRLGFLAAPEPIAKAIDAVQSHSTSNPTSFAQKGGVAALTGPQDHLPLWLAEFDKRRRYAHQKLNSIPGISCVNAKGAFYLFPNISKTGLKSIAFGRVLREGIARSRRKSPPCPASPSAPMITSAFQLRHQHGEHREGMLDRIEKFCGEIDQTTGLDRWLHHRKANSRDTDVVEAKPGGLVPEPELERRAG